MQALEYKSFLRFRVAKILDDLCANQLQPLLLKTLLNRAEGALLINAVGVDDVKQADEMVKLATAVAHLIGRSNFDAMSGQYYARFVVKNVDNSDSYLRQPHRVMEAQAARCALSGLPVRRLLLTRSPVSAAPPGRNHADPSPQHILRRRHDAPCPGYQSADCC